MFLLNEKNTNTSFILEKRGNGILIAPDLYSNLNFSDNFIELTEVSINENNGDTIVSKIFKQETGRTLMNYMIGKRMEEAKKLLLQTNYKSLVIGEMVGYPEPNYFSYVFKKNCGISPAKYRKQNDEK